MQTESSRVQHFPVPARIVWMHLLHVAGDLGAVERDDLLKRVTIKLGMSAMSWGETLYASVEECGQGASRGVMKSVARLGSNVGAAPKNAANMERLIQLVSESIQGKREPKPVARKTTPREVAIAMAVVVIVILVLTAIAAFRDLVAGG